jgi:GntR family transcriptional regulator
MDNIKEMIVTDVWGENSKIPSVRELSEQLTLNPNTVQKAYKILEDEGLIESHSGAKSYVAVTAEKKEKIRPTKGGLPYISKK